MTISLLSLAIGKYHDITKYRYTAEHYSTSTIRWPFSHCGVTNYYPRNCPFRSYAIPAPTEGQRLTTTSSFISGQQPITGGLPNFKPSTCHAYNHSICRHQNCLFLHQCELCGADHSAKYCPNRAALLNKPKLWTPIWPFILERELCI